MYIEVLNAKEKMKNINFILKLYVTKWRIQRYLKSKILSSYIKKMFMWMCDFQVFSIEVYQKRDQTHKNNVQSNKS